MSDVENNTEQEAVQEEKQAVIKHKKATRKKKFYYSFLTLVLLLCIVQIGFGTVLNISKTISNTSKIKTMEHILDNAEAYNGHLKNEIKLFSKDKTLEGIARNNLKMAGEDEVLVIINEANDESNTGSKDAKNKTNPNDTKVSTSETKI